MNKDFYSGFIRLHILYHAEKKPTYGLCIIKELNRNGYEISPGTLYPILHKMEGSGYLQSQKEVVKGKNRRVYMATQLGAKVLAEAKEKVRALFGEIFIEREVCQ